MYAGFAVGLLARNWFITCLLFLATTSLFAHVPEESWKLSMEKDGIRVYSRKRPGSGMREMKAEMTISGMQPGKVIRLIRNDSMATEWINRAVQFRTLHTENPNEWFTYTEVAIPWPFPNKDLITRNRLVASPGKTLIEMLSQPDFYPEQAGKSRIGRSDSRWIIVQEAGGTHITYEVFAESSGGLPEWVVMPILVRGLYSTFEQMRNLLAETKD